MAIPILWRTTKERYSLQGEKCPECSRMIFPPRPRCPYCGGETGMHGIDRHATQAQAAAEKCLDFAFVMPSQAELHAAGDD